MNMRFEYKYVVAKSELESLRRSLSPYVICDPYAARGKDHFYTVRSIYLDTPTFSAYREKLEGVKVRRKYRIRGYDVPRETSRVFLEIKQKINQQGFKYRSQLAFGDLGRLLETREVERYVQPEPCTAEACENARRFLFGVDKGMMKPAMLVVYDREAFVGSIDPRVRITFDFNLRCAPLPALSGLCDDTNLQCVASGLAVVEIKFDRGYGPWLRSIVNKYGLVRTSISKYASCLCASRNIAPLLPRNIIRGEHASIMGRTEVVGL
jgi:hypothetical protein